MIINTGNNAMYNIFVIYNIYDGKMGMVALEIFLLCAGNLARIDFDLLNLFQS